MTLLQAQELEGPIALQEDEGLLILQVKSNAPLLQVRGGRAKFGPITPGDDSLMIFRAPAGNYRWSRVKVQSPRFGKVDFRLSRSNYLREDELEFSIEPGRLNYTGDLLFHYDYPYITVRNRNHSAMAIRAVERRYPELLDRFELRFGGTTGDPFIAFYSDERNRVKPAQSTQTSLTNGRPKHQAETQP